MVVVKMVERRAGLMELLLVESKDNKMAVRSVGLKAEKLEHWRAES